LSNSCLKRSKTLSSG